MKFGNRGQFDPVLPVLLLRVEEFEPRGIDSGERQWFIHPHHHHRDSPVPAAVTMHLAHQIEVFRPRTTVHRNGDRKLVENLLPFGSYRFELDADQIASRLQEFLHVAPVAAEHVRRRHRPPPVERNRREGVDHLRIEIDALILQQLRRHVEFPEKLPLIFAEVLNFIFIPSEIRIRNHSRRIQCTVGVSGKLRRNVPPRQLRATQRPISIQNQMRHREIS